MPLHSLDAPLDPIVLNFLDSIKAETVILNDVDGIRKVNNKIYTTSFHTVGPEYLPETYVSKNKEYLEAAQEGDVRVLMLGGEYVGAYQRRPSPDDIRANIQAGATAHAVTLSDEQHQLLRKIGPQLMADGLHFVGLDLIGNKLLEVNVLNPGGITNINRLNRKKLEKKVLDYVERLVPERHAKHSELELRLSRLAELRQHLDGAH